MLSCCDPFQFFLGTILDFVTPFYSGWIWLLLSLIAIPIMSGLCDFSLECTRKQGDVVRYDWLTKEFGILSSSGTIHSYYKPDRNVHRKLFHVCYFKRECKRIFKS